MLLLALESLTQFPLENIVIGRPGLELQYRVAFFGSLLSLAPCRALSGSWELASRLRSV